MSTFQLLLIWCSSYAANVSGRHCPIHILREEQPYKNAYYTQASQTTNCLIWNVQKEKKITGISSMQTQRLLLRDKLNARTNLFKCYLMSAICGNHIMLLCCQHHHQRVVFLYKRARVPQFILIVCKYV